MSVWPSLLRPRPRILSSPEISTSQMLLLPHGPPVPRFHRCKSSRRGGLSIRRTARALAPERGHVEATARRQESVHARASGRRCAVAPPHTRNCAGPACIHTHTMVSKRTTEPTPTPRLTTQRRKERAMTERIRTCTSQYPPPCTLHQRRTRLGARARRAYARTRCGRRSRGRRA
jgi:hypothetical protein